MGSVLRGLGFGLASLKACAGLPAPPPPPPPSIAAPATSPPTAAKVEPARSAEPTRIHILVAGDLLPHRPMLVAPERLRAALDPLRPLLARADVAVANYESATGDPSRMGAHDISLSATAGWMGAAGSYFHALTVANNHACDLGRRGLEATLDAAEEEGVLALGADDGGSPLRARVLFEKDGRRVCAVAWTTFVNTETRGCPASGKLAIAGADAAGEHAVARAIAGARSAGCDATVAILHGGREYETQDLRGQVLARVAAEAGADAVVIHHPHVPSPVRIYATRDGRRVPVFLSVGNLVSNQGESFRPPMPATSPTQPISTNAWTRLGVIADLDWSWPARVGPGVQPAFGYGYHLTWTDNEHAARHDEPMPRIETRVLEANDPLVGELSREAKGPTGLFVDPCWVELGQPGCGVGAPASVPRVEATRRRARKPRT